jgi:hypothetical protein
MIQPNCTHVWTRQFLTVIQKEAKSKKAFPIVSAIIHIRFGQYVGCRGS